MLLSTSTLTPSYLFSFNDTATTEIYTLSYTTLFRSVFTESSDHHVLFELDFYPSTAFVCIRSERGFIWPDRPTDRKSTRLNSSHVEISYAVFCLKKKIYINGVDRTGRPIGFVRSLDR